MVGTILRGIIVLTLFSKYTCLPNFECPTSAELGSSVNLRCFYSSSSNAIYSRPDGTVAVSCNDRGCGTPADRVNITITNTTHSTLSVTEIDWEDEGEWECKTNSAPATCRLNLYKIPSCSITSEQNTDRIKLGEQLSLSLAVKEFYCSKTAGISLNAGSTSVDVNRTVPVTANVTNNATFVSTFNVSESQFGSLNLTFHCGTDSWDLRCSGIIKLQRAPPGGTIRANLDTNKLDVGDNLTLTVSIEEYPCLHGNAFYLNTGDVQFPLVTNTSGAVNKSVNLNVTDAHFGDVNINYTCNDVNHIVSFAGVTVLNTRQNLEEEFPAWAIALIVIPIIIIAIIIGVIIVIVKKNKINLTG